MNYSSVTYEDVHKDLKKFFNLFKKLNTGKYIKDSIHRQSQDVEDGFSNRLLEDILEFRPDELVDEIRDEYLENDGFIKGEIGIVDPTDQYYGIIDIASTVLLCNRVGKNFQAKEKKVSMSEEQYKKNHENYQYCMDKKGTYTYVLMSALYLYKELENDNEFNYGLRIDKYDDPTFCIDIPERGQMCVHFGSKKKMADIKQEALDLTQKILDKKRDIGEITEEEYEKLLEKTTMENILPNYEGKLYEYKSIIPLSYKSERFEEIDKKLGLNKKDKDTLIDEDITKMVENGVYNNRELYYYAIKKPFSREQLIGLSKTLEKTDNELSGNEPELVSMEDMENAYQTTNAEQRANAYADIKDQKNLSNTKESEITNGESK